MKGVMVNMWKLLYSDYETDKVSKVNNEKLSILDCVVQYSIPLKTKFTIVGLYADNKKYTVMANCGKFIFATKPFSTHKNNTKYWLVIINVLSQQFLEFVIDSKDVIQDIKNTIEDISKNGIEGFDYTRSFTIDPVNANYNNGEPYQASISEIDRFWVEQLRGKKLGE